MNSEMEINNAHLKSKTYKSRVDWFFKSALILVAMVLTFTTFFLLKDEEESVLTKIFFLSIVSIVCAIFYHILTHTFYRIESEALHIQSSIFKKRLKYESITEIRRNKTLFIGWKLALASKGLVIHYNKFDVVYISPVDEDDFIKMILVKNPKIKIVEKDHLK